MTMKTPNDLFEHELQDLYDAEHRFLKALSKMADECQTEEARSAFEQHAEETEQHIKNLDKCFQLLSTQAKRTTCYGAQGMVQEHNHFTDENPSPQILEMFDIGAGLKAEHYEIVSYTGLSEKAKLMGQQQIADLLQQNLKQEQAMADRLQKIEMRLAKDVLQGAGAR